MRVACLLGDVAGKEGVWEGIFEVDLVCEISEAAERGGNPRGTEGISLETSIDFYGLQG
jgi:hypothetical protein